MRELIQEWKSDRLWGALSIGWLLTVVFSFENGGIISIEVPGLGSIFGYRVFLLTTVVLYSWWAIKNRLNIWHQASTIEKWAYVFILVMLIYGALSLPRAISFDRTFRMLFNLTFDMAFFFLAIQLCKEKKMRRVTLYLALTCFVIIVVLGIYEVFFGGVVNHDYDAFRTHFSGVFSQFTFQFPHVFLHNTNDYSEAIVFTLSVFLLTIFYWDQEKKNLGWGLIVLAIIVGFLLNTASARLCIFAYYILMGGLIVSSFFRDRLNQKQVLILLIAVILITLDFPDSPHEGEKLSDQFLSADEAGNPVGSASVRLSLLIHCWNSFIGSHGLGVGLGNTGQLAIIRQVAKLPYSNGYYESIHCFIARVIADYGLCALVPLCAIALLMLRSIYRLFTMGIKDRKKDIVAFSILMLAVILIYPFASTASSDAQDSTSMWLYLAMFILLCNQIDKQFIKRRNGDIVCPELSSLPL